MPSPRIAVFGSSQVAPGDPAWQEAVAVGRGLAEADCVLVTGGYGGVMEAASLGSREAGGHTIGLTLGLLGSRQANAAVVEEIHAADLFDRLRNFVDHADGFIALPGGVGTLLEIALLWNLKVLNAHDGPPVWLVGSAWATFHDLCRRDLVIREQDFAHVALLPDGASAVAAVRAHFNCPS